MSAEAGLPLSTISIIIGSVVGFVALLTIIWNFSKKITTLELDNAQAKTRYEQDLASIEKKHIEDVKALENEIHRHSSERREDISNSTIRHKDEINNIQKQLDSSKSDVKSLLSKIEVAYTSINTGEKTHDEIKTELARLLDFITRWNQRIEDRIESLRKEFLMMFTSFHGNGDTKHE